MQIEEAEIVIIGAGPTGLTLSIALHQAGIGHVLIDRLSQGQNTSRAGVIHAQTLESLSGLGVADRMGALGLKLAKFAIRDRGRALVDLRFDRLPSRHPYLLMLPQNITEQVLTERIAELGGSVRRGVEATFVTQNANGAEVQIVENGERKLIRARYIVGADGMRSIVREAAGIGFEGAAYDGAFVLADVRMDWALGRDEVSLFFSPDGLVVVAPLPDGTYRVVATMDQASETPSLADIQALIDTRGPHHAPSKVQEVVWGSRFRVHHRLANAYRNQRLLLIGDAAHVHSPAGGQGMNTGIIDAVVLGEILAGVSRGLRPEADLDLYEQLRRPAAQQVLGMAGRLTGMATVHGSMKRMARNALLSVINHNPIAKRRLAMNLSGLARAELAQVAPVLAKAA